MRFSTLTHSFTPRPPPPQASTLGEQLALIALVTQLTSLSLCDAASCSMPSSGLSHVSKLTALKELNLIVQSTGDRAGLMCTGLGA